MHVLLELSYTFDHICTNLLTQCTQLPVPVFCCFCISGFPAIKSAPKILEKLYKKSASRKPPETPRKEGRTTTGTPEGSLARPHPRPHRAPSWLPCAPLGAPFGLYLVPAEETPNIDLLFPFYSLYRCRRRFYIGAARRSCPDTLPEGGTPSGRPSLAMDASRMCREYSPLDHGSVTSSYVMYSSPLCAFTFETS